MKFTTEHFQRLQSIHNLYISYNKAMEIGNFSHWRITRRERQNFYSWKNSKWHCQGTRQQQLTSLVCKVSQIRKQSRDGADFLSANGPHSMRELCVKGKWNLQELPQSLGDFLHMEKLFLRKCYSLQRLPDSIGRLSRMKDLDLRKCFHLTELPASIGNLSQLQNLYLKSCWNLQELPATIGSLQNLRQLKILDCIVLKGLPSSLGNPSNLETLIVKGCWMVETIHTQALCSLLHLHVIGCVNLRSIAGLWGLSKVKVIRIEGCLNLIHIAGYAPEICESHKIFTNPVFSKQECQQCVSEGGAPTEASISRSATFNSLRSLNISGFYHLRLHPHHGLVQQLPHDLYELRISLNNGLLSALFDKDTKTLSKLNPKKVRHGVVNAKTSPLFFPALKEKVRDLLSTKDESLFSFYDLSHHTDEPKNMAYVAAVLCFVSAVYAVDLPIHVPPPQTRFTVGKILHRLDDVTRFDFEEEIQMATLHGPEPSKMFHCYLPIMVDAYKINDYPRYEASGKEGWVIFLHSGEGSKNDVLAKQICNIFYSELVKQRLMSHAWTHLPSQLDFFKFSALDIAGCQISRISRHCNTCIMEEEIDLTWNRRRCVFADDQALLLLQHPRRRSSSKHSFLAYPGLRSDLEAGMLANLYEMSIFSSFKGKLTRSIKLQELVSINEQDIPPALNTLLHTNASDSTLGTMHTKLLHCVRRLRRQTYFSFRS